MAKSYKRSLQQKFKAELNKTAGQASSEVFQKALTLKKKLRRKAIRFTKMLQNAPSCGRG